MDKIRILQIGEVSWKDRYVLPERVKIIFAKDKIALKKEGYEITILERNITEEEFAAVKQMSVAYCLFIVDNFTMS